MFIPVFNLFPFPYQPFPGRRESDRGYLSTRFISRRSIRAFFSLFAPNLFRRRRRSVRDFRYETCLLFRQPTVRYESLFLFV